MAENAKIQHFMGKNRVVVPVQKNGTDTHDVVGSMGLVPVPLLPATLFLHVMQF